LPTLACGTRSARRSRATGRLAALFPKSDPRSQVLAVAFRQGMENLGWSVGRNLAIDYRCGAFNVERARVSDIRNRQLRATSGCEQSQQSTASFDHLVGGREQRLRHRKAERPVVLEHTSLRRHHVWNILVYAGDLLVSKGVNDETRSHRRKRGPPGPLTELFAQAVAAPATTSAAYRPRPARCG
jgi:hypothetical protein